MLPQPAERSLADTLAALESTPLFMTMLPSAECTDPVLGALQSLAFEGTPDEIAHNFKEQGNGCFQQRRLRDALGFYTQGIDAQPSDVALHEALLCNRAACNLGLENYASVLRDCSKALALNAKCSKAYCRSAAALLALGRLDESLDCCHRCLAYDPHNARAQSLGDRTAQAKADKSKKDRDVQARIQEKDLLHTALKERHLVDVSDPNVSAHNPYEPHFDPDDPARATLIIPVCFRYPQHATSDLIAHFVEHTAFSAHVARMFPPAAPAPAWDSAGQYAADSIVIYATTRHRRLLKVGKKMTLSDVCHAAAQGAGDDGLQLENGCLSFVVLPKGAVEQEWVAGFKRKRDAGVARA